MEGQAGKQPKFGNWLHSQCIETQWVEEERAAVDTKMDTNLAMMPDLRTSATRGGGGGKAVSLSASGKSARSEKVRRRSGHCRIESEPVRPAKVLRSARGPLQKRVRHLRH